MKLTFSPMGDEHILIDFGSKVSKEVLARIIACRAVLEPHVLECSSGYTTLMIRYNPLKSEYRSNVKRIKNTLKCIDFSSEFNPETHIIEVQYGGSAGKDLHRVAEYNNLTEKQVVNLHTQTPYTVYMIGFLPGFCYLGGLEKKLFTPRLETPRKKITKGSVGIAGNQTGVYPIESPGGWNIIGITEYEFFTRNYPPIEIKIGDLIKFIEV